jgi:Ca-activated chloride channel family protein
MNVTFANPDALVLLPFAMLAVLAAEWWRRRAAGGLLFPSLGLVATIAPSVRVRSRGVLPILRIVGLALVALALARPEVGERVTETSILGSDVVVALDISTSMQEPTFGRPKYEITRDAVVDFLGKLDGERTGLVAFAGEVAVYSPMTSDYAAVSKMVTGLKPGQLRGGTAIGDGLAVSIDVLRDSPAVSKAVVLLTDGLSNSDKVKPIDAAQIARALNVRVYTIGALSPVGGQQGIDERLMAQVSELTGGRYFRAQDPAALQATYDAIAQLERTRVTTETLHSMPIDWALAAGGLALLALEVGLATTILRSAP